MDEQMIADLFAEKLCEWSALGKMDDPTEVAKVAARETAHSVIAGKVAELEGALGELVRRFDRRDWVLSGDDSKALFHARAALAPYPERR